MDWDGASVCKYRIGLFWSWSREEAPRIAAVSVLFVESVSECLEGLWGPDWQRRTWRKGSLWESKCTRMWVWDSVILTMNLHPAVTPYPPPLLSTLLTSQSNYLQASCHMACCHFHSSSGFPVLSPLALFIILSPIQVLHYRTPWGLACCLSLPGVLYGSPVVSASGFLIKCPCNRSPCDTGNTVTAMG